MEQTPRDLAERFIALSLAIHDELQQSLTDLADEERDLNHFIQARQTCLAQIAAHPGPWPDALVERMRAADEALITAAQDCRSQATGEIRSFRQSRERISQYASPSPVQALDLAS